MNSAAVRRLFAATVLLLLLFFLQSTSNSLSAGSRLRRGQDANALLRGSRGSLTDAAIQGERKNLTMTEYEHMEMNPISPARDGCFPPPPSRLSATLNNSLTVRADLAHQLTDKYLKRKAVR